MGLVSSRLMLDSSVLHGNAVRPPQAEENGVEVVVRLNTGTIGLGTFIDSWSPDYFAPIWRVDDGPVYGISSELCEAAERTAHRPDGVPSTWPGLQCQNVTYHGPNHHYSHVIGVEEGLHTLWTGVYIESATPNSAGWGGGGWIDIGGVLDPLFPAPLDDRTQRFPGCQAGQNCVTYCDQPGQPRCDECCPPGEVTWAGAEFRASTGQAGAVEISGPVAVSISDSDFRANEAPKASALSITAAGSVQITNTTIVAPDDDPSSVVERTAATIASCAENPCDAGSKCRFRDFSTFCEPCAENEVSVDGVECTTCPPGTQPDDPHT
eukprot:COSAG04_NODE_8496_length_966_cov_1.136101_1_plen_322_part_11